MSRGPHIRNLFDLSGRAAMVTGGAQNLGLDMAEALGEAGADLVITSRQLDKAQAAAETLKAQLGVQVLPLALDVTDEESVAEGFRQVQETCGRLDVLVCNAGGARLTGGGVTTDTRLPEDWDAVMAINLKGAFLCVRAALPLMRNQGNGSIILIASLSGMVGRNRWVYEGSDMVPNMTDYSTVKGGLIAFARDLAAENGCHGIRVNALSPGGFERGQPEEFIRRYNSQTMLGRMGRDGTDLKGAVVYLASEASAYVTGQNLAVDGGFSAW
jgi:NAD(P)-dependent dehydrogenase (short-subunit alcohol dehydrogenase family)